MVTSQNFVTGYKTPSFPLAVREFKNKMLNNPLPLSGFSGLMKQMRIQRKRNMVKNPNW